MYLGEIRKPKDAVKRKYKQSTDSNNHNKPRQSNTKKIYSCTQLNITYRQNTQTKKTTTNEQNMETRHMH